tara:strand:- start:1926 stop:2063 length:138 start_codon:yes stop_codon:yes gene_type:complete
MPDKKDLPDLCSIMRDHLPTQQIKSQYYQIKYLQAGFENGFKLKK